MPLVFRLRERFRQDVCHLLWIMATVDEDLSILDYVVDPVPTDHYMLGALVELWVPHHHNRAVVIAPDQRWDVLLEQAEFTV